MSKLGKLFLWLALAGAIAAAVAGVLLIQTYKTTQATLTDTTAQKSKAEAAAKAAKAEALKNAQDAADKQTQLTAANSKLEEINGKLTQAQSDADTAKKALDTANAAADKAKADLAAIQGTLNGQSPADLIAAKDTAQKAADAAEADKKIMQDNLDKQLVKIQELTDVLKRVQSHSDIAPGVTGKITCVNSTWNFVVLDIGMANGVIPNGELMVFRKNTLLGKVKITSVEENTAVADILPNVKGQIQVGDTVLN